MRFKVLVFLLSIIVVLGLSLCANNPENIVKSEAVATVSAENVTVSKGGTGTVDISVDEVPSDRLSYVNLTVGIANPTVTQIQDVSFPDWATLSQDFQHHPQRYGSRWETSAIMCKLVIQMCL